MHHAVGVHNPRHDLRIGTHVRRGHIFIGADEQPDLGGEPPCHALELAGAQSARVDDNATFRAAVRQAGDSALPRHPHGERAHFIERDVLAVAQAALHRPARFVVMHAIAGEDTDGAIVHLHREVHRELALAVAQDVTHAGIEADTFCDGVELCNRGVEGIFPGGCATGAFAMLCAVTLMAYEILCVHSTRAGGEMDPEIWTQV